MRGLRRRIQWGYWRSLTRIVALPFCHIVLQGERPPPVGYPTELTTIGDRIRKKRMDRGLRQKDVARGIGVSVCTITNWELGRTTPMAHYAPEIARFLGLVDDPGGESPCLARDPASVFQHFKDCLCTSNSAKRSTLLA